MKNKLVLTVLILCLFLFANRTYSQSTDSINVRKTISPPPSIKVLKTAPAQPDVVYTTYDQPPIPPGGADGYRTYLSKNIHYPNSAIKANASGAVYVSIVVDKNGSLSDVHIEKDNAHFGCGAEAVRVIKNMPPWTPGKLNGTPVKVRYVIPVRFRLK